MCWPISNERLAQRDICYDYIGTRTSPQQPSARRRSLDSVFLLPTVLHSPITAHRDGPVQMLQCGDRLPDLAPQCCFIAPEPLENFVVQIGQTKKGVSK